MLQLQKLIVSDHVALQKWPTIVEHIVPTAADKLRIKKLISKDHEYEEAVLDSLRLWKADGGQMADLLKVFRDHKLNALAERIVEEGIVLEEATLNKPFGNVWFEVGEVVYNFTGREAELRDLHQILKKSHTTKSSASNIVSVCGLGGIGKSNLAKEYAHRYRNEYDGNVIWINAEKIDSMRASFTRLANYVGLVVGDHESNPNIVKRIYERFNNQKSLFIFDNVDSKLEFSPFLPRVDNPDKQTPYILVTTRRNDIVAVTRNQLNLGVLKTNEALELILIQLPYATRESAVQLAEKLQMLPLALQQALAYIKDIFTNDEDCIVKYLEELEESTETLLQDERFKENIDYSMTTYTTWRVTLKRIETLSAIGFICSRFRSSKLS